MPLCGSTMNLISRLPFRLKARVVDSAILARTCKRCAACKKPLQMVISIPAMLITQIIIALRACFRLNTSFVLFACSWCLRCLQHFRALYQPDVPKLIGFQKLWLSSRRKHTAYHAWLTVAIVIPIVLYVFVLDKHMDILHTHCCLLPYLV